MWTVTLGVLLGIALPANAEIIRGIMLVRGCEMS
jgi:hypothetical protein